MKCAVHSEVDATGYCRNCGKAMCPACVRPVRDVLYCEDCLATTMGIPAQQSLPASAEGAAYPSAAAAAGAPPTRSAHNPAAAFALGLFPGLGAVYNGEYNKALIQVVVFAAIIVGLNSDLGDGPETALSLLLAGFVLYMGFDAMRTAKARNLGETSVDPLESWSKERPIGPMILIAMGALFLLNNFGVFSFFHIHRLWPLILIAVGVLMFQNRISSRS
jgi:Domain of unknown function (DUF5668)